jgi:hypothetical protein
MRARLEERKKALELRRRGFSYSEILKKVPVAKSSLSLWLRSTPISESQRDRFRRKIIANAKLGAIAKRKQRIEKTEKIKRGAISEIKQIGDRELFYMGIMLYWAEGAKSRGTNISQGVDFSNSDPDMCKFFVSWLQTVLKIKPERIGFCIYIHESQRNKSDEALDYWSNIVEFSKDKFNKTCFTKTVYPGKHKREDKGNYYGQLRIRVRKSTNLNRKITGWINGIYLRCGVSKLDKV